MKKMLFATAMLLTFTCSAIAAPDPVNANRSGFYVGGQLGTAVNNDGRISYGALGGFQMGPHIRLEATYDNASVGKRANMFMGNVIGQYRIPNSVVTPYVLVGTGMSYFGSQSTGTYAVGGGVRFAASQSIELDARYRYIGAYDTNYIPHAGMSAITVGVNYRF